MKNQDRLDITALQVLDLLIAYCAQSDCEQAANCLEPLFPTSADRAALEQLFRVIRRRYGMNDREAFAHACRVLFTAMRLAESAPGRRPGVRMLGEAPRQPDEKRYLDYRFGDLTPIRIGQVPTLEARENESSHESRVRARLQQHLLESSSSAPDATPRMFLLPSMRYTSTRLVRNRVLYRGGIHARLEIEFEPPCERARLLLHTSTESRMLFGTGNARYLRFLLSGRTLRRDEPARLAATPPVQFFREALIADEPLIFMLAPSGLCDDGSRTLVIVHGHQIESLTLMPSEEDRAEQTEAAARVQPLLCGETTHQGWIPASGSYLEQPLGTVIARKLWDIAQTLEPSRQRVFA